MTDLSQMLQNVEGGYDQALKAVDGKLPGVATLKTLSKQFVGAPVVGKLLDGMTEVMQGQQKRVWIPILVEEVYHVRDRIDTNCGDAEELAGVFLAVQRVAEGSLQAKKLRATARILANALLAKGDSKKLSHRELDHFVRCLDRLSHAALEAISVAPELARKNVLGADEIPLDAMGSKLGIRDDELLHGLFAELVATGLARLPIAQPYLREGLARPQAYLLTGTGTRLVQSFLYEKPRETGKRATEQNMQETEKEKQTAE